MSSEKHGLIVLGLLLGAFTAASVVQAASTWGKTEFQYFFSFLGTLFTALAAGGAWRSANSSNRQAKLMQQTAADSLEARRPMVEIELQEPLSADFFRSEEDIRAAIGISLQNLGMSGASQIRFRHALMAFEEGMDVECHLENLMQNGAVTSHGDWLVMPNHPRNVTLHFSQELARDAELAHSLVVFLVIDYKTPGAPRVWKSGMALGLVLLGDLEIGVSRSTLQGKILARRHI